MKTLKFLVLVLFLSPLFTNGKAFSQDTWEYRNQIKFTPLRTLNLLNPGFEVSYERKYAKKIATQVSMAYLVDLFTFTPCKDYNGYRFLLEEKLYLFKHRFFMQYASLEGGYYAANMIRTSTFERKDTGLSSDRLVYDDTYHLKRTGIIFNTKYGVQFLFDSFVMDVSVGLGIITHTIVHSNRAYPDDELALLYGPNYYYMWEVEGKRSILNFPFSLKIGYSF